MHSLPHVWIISTYLLYLFKLSFSLHEMLSSSDAQRSKEQQAEPSGTSELVDSPSSYAPLRDILVECAEAVSKGQWHLANRLIALLSVKASVHGDASDRVIAYFTCSLASRAVRFSGGGQASVFVNYSVPDPSTEEIQVAYLALNKVTPFIRFAHLTANQAILEALEGLDSVHIVDFEIMQGVQWPPLMQALAERPGGPPCLRITGIGSDMNIVQQTGNRLEKFADSLRLPFEFHALHASSIEDVTPSMLDTRTGEGMAVNCVLELHRLLQKDGDILTAFLAMIRSLEPKVVTLGEREANHNQPFFLEQFKDALNYYSAMFDSLEATLPPTSSDRIVVERILLGQEIMNVIAFEGSERTRHEKFTSWRELMKASNFTALHPSTFAVAQARLLLRLHYPSEGYNLHEEDDCLLLGWKDTPLFAVSSWN